MYFKENKTLNFSDWLKKNKLIKVLISVVKEHRVLNNVELDTLSELKELANKVPASLIEDNIIQIKKLIKEQKQEILERDSFSRFRKELRENLSDKDKALAKKLQERFIEEDKNKGK